MTRTILFAILASSALAACNPVDVSRDDSNSEEQAAANSEALTKVLAADLRAEDKARDAFRNPKETLEFFDVKPGHTVIEYAPGGGWYTRILAPYVSDKGKYIAVGFPPEAGASIGPDFVDRMRKGGETFSETQSKSIGIAAEKLPLYFSNALPEDVNGTVDRVLIFRMMHNLLRWGIAEDEIKRLKATLKPDALVGIVQHRAASDAPDDYTDGNKGYLKQAIIVSWMEEQGFEFLAESEVNANPKDTANYPQGVWTLPPSYAEGEETKAKYDAIGESDRMTLLFKLADAPEASEN